MKIHIAYPPIYLTELLKATLKFHVACWILSYLFLITLQGNGYLQYLHNDRLVFLLGKGGGGRALDAAPQRYHLRPQSRPSVCPILIMRKHSIITQNIQNLYSISVNEDTIQNDENVRSRNATSAYWPTAPTTCMFIVHFLLWIASVVGMRPGNSHKISLTTTTT